MVCACVDDKSDGDTKARGKVRVSKPKKVGRDACACGEGFNSNLQLQVKHP